MKDYYGVLGVAADATLPEIKSAYRKLVLCYHPDRNTQSHEQKVLAEERFKEIAEAYEVLGNEMKRRRYDFTIGGLATQSPNLHHISSPVTCLRPWGGRCGRGLGRGLCGGRAGRRRSGKSQDSRKPF